jgi:hypothetical protein
MIKIIQTWLKIKGKEVPADVSVQVSEPGKINLGDLKSVLKVAVVTGLATLITTLATHLSSVEVTDQTFVVFIPLVTAGLHAVSRWLLTSFTTKVEIK